MKTMAIRLEDDLHAQLTMLAALDKTTISDILRRAIDDYVAAKRAEPDFAERAEAMLAEIDREAAERRSAISTLFAPEGDEPDEAEPADADVSDISEARAKPASRRTTKKA